MLKFLVIALVWANRNALCNKREVIFPAADSEFAKSSVGKPEAGGGVSSFSDPSSTKSQLGLTTGDLKVFSGHALKLLRSKCPNVDQAAISGLQKFISSSIAKIADPVPGNGQKFREVLKTVTTCSDIVISQANTKSISSPKPEVLAEEKAKSFQSPKPTAIRGQDDRSTPKVPSSSNHAEKKESTDVLNKQSAKENSDKVTAQGGKIVKIFPDDSPLSSADWQSNWSKMSSAEKEYELYKSLSAAIKNEPVTSTTTVRTTTTARTTTTTRKLKLPVMATTSNNEEKRGFFGGIFNWIKGFFNNITSLFKGLFGGIGGRKRRSANTDEDPTGIVAHAQKDLPKGQPAFMQLIEDLSRIYRDKCVEINLEEFKIASQELLDYLFAHISASSIKLAVDTYLTPEVLEEIQSCINSY